MKSLQIRALPDDVYEALRLRAQHEHRSLAQQAIVELRRLPELEGRQSRLRALAALKQEIADCEPIPLPVTPEALIREDRER